MFTFPLKVGDKLLSVNGHSLVEADHYGAVEVLRSSGHSLVLVISREVSRLVPLPNAKVEFFFFYSLFCFKSLILEKLLSKNLLVGYLIYLKCFCFKKRKFTVFFADCLFVLTSIFVLLITSTEMCKRRVIMLSKNKRIEAVIEKMCFRVQTLLAQA